jgi:hypothetical protein
MLRSIVLILLPLLSVAGAFGTYVLGFRIGTFEIINGVLAQKNALFPGSDTTLVRNFTGIEVIDHQLQILVVFFAPVVGSGSNDLMLFCMVGAGQVSSISRSRYLRCRQMHFRCISPKNLHCHY